MKIIDNRTDQNRWRTNSLDRNENQHIDTLIFFSCRFRLDSSIEEDLQKNINPNELTMIKSSEQFDRDILFIRLTLRKNLRFDGQRLFCWKSYLRDRDIDNRIGQLITIKRLTAKRLFLSLFFGVCQSSFYCYLQKKKKKRTDQRDLLMTKIRHFSFFSILPRSTTIKKLVRSVQCTKNQFKSFLKIFQASFFFLMDNSDD